MLHSTKQFKVIVASVLAAACLAVPTAAYTSMGRGVNYEVSTAYPNWNNKGDSAWLLTQRSKCNFKATSTNSTSRATFTLMQWTVFDKAISSWAGVSSVDSDLSSAVMEADDYYAKVALTTGSKMEGTVTFSVKS